MVLVTLGGRTVRGTMLDWRMVDPASRSWEGWVQLADGDGPARLQWVPGTAIRLPHD